MPKIDDATASDMLAILCELVDPDEFDKHPQDFVEPWHRARAIISRAQGFTSGEKETQKTTDGIRTP